MDLAILRRDLRLSTLLYLGVSGALAGALNSLLCLFHWPEPIEFDGEPFAWNGWLVFAGAAHGGVLAGFVGAGARLLERLPVRFWILFAAPVAWLGGWISFSVLQMDAVGGYSAGEMEADYEMGKLFFWPLLKEHPVKYLLDHEAYDANLIEYLQGLLLAPLFAFGWVLLIGIPALAWFQRRASSQWRVAILVGLLILAGTLGSLHWWCRFDLWINAVIHGAFWGLATGVAVYLIQARQDRASLPALSNSQ